MSKFTKYSDVIAVVGTSIIAAIVGYCVRQNVLPYVRFGYKLMNHKQFDDAYWYAMRTTLLWGIMTTVMFAVLTLLLIHISKTKPLHNIGLIAVVIFVNAAFYVQIAVSASQYHHDGLMAQTVLVNKSDKLTSVLGKH